MTTIKKIAELANVSIGTVDRVIHNRGRVSRKTFEKVNRIIEEIGYKPNPFARNLKLNRTFRFGIIMPHEHQDGGYWEKPANGMRKALESLRISQIQGEFYYFDKYSGNADDPVYTSPQFKTLDGILAAPALTDRFTRLFTHWPDDKPYVFFDTDLPGTSPLSVISQDAYQSGRLAAGLILKSARGEGPFLVFKPVPDDFHICARVKGFTELIESERKSEIIIHEIEMGRGNGISEKRLMEILGEHPKAQGIFVPNADTFQVASVISNISPASRPVLVGYDLIEPNAGWLERGVIDFIISQRPEMQGYQGIYALYRHFVLNEQVGKRIEMPLEIITRENMHSDSFITHA
jgi:LacI family transcriptional regulator